MTYKLRTWFRDVLYPASHPNDWVIWVEFGPARLVGFDFGGGYRVYEGIQALDLLSWIETSPAWTLIAKNDC
jgi:hypothetical protein